MNHLGLLHTHCGWSLRDINRVITGYREPQRLHNAVLADSCSQELTHACFTPIMIYWGVATRGKRWVNDDGELIYPREARDALWKAYFPDTRPHIYHLLTYVHDQDLSGKPTGVSEGDRYVKAGYSRRVIDKILRQPRLHRRQVDRIRRFAIAYIDTIGSKSCKRGPDPAYMGLYYALNDPKRMFRPGEIIAD